MDAVNDPSISTVVIMSAAQVGKTEVLNNVIGYHIHHDPAPMLMVMPTLEMAQSWSKDRLSGMLRDTPALRHKVKDPRSRDSGNTTLHKVFNGGHITGCGANSPASLASRPVRVVLCDEVDRYPASAGSEGDPILLAKRRSATFWNRKLILTSTPTVKGASRIEAAFEESDQRYYYVPCGDCGEFQTLVWRNVHWPKDRPAEAVYTCEHCGSVWTDAGRYRAINKGEWRAEDECAGIAGFYLNGLYSPWKVIADAALDFIRAKKLPETLRVWTNTFLAESWEDAGERIDDFAIADRREEYAAQVPAGVVAITAGVDVQDDRLEVEVLGHGRDEESWSIIWRTIYGDPSGSAVWNDLDDLIGEPLTHELGGELHIRATCIDSGGHHTNAVYSFCRPREGKRIFAIKGIGGEGRALAGRPTKNNIGKVRLFPIGVNGAKDLIFARLRIQEPGPGYCHFPVDYDDEFFRQLTAEKCVTRFHKGFPRREYIKTRPRNDALDCRVYAMAAFAILNMNINRLADRQTENRAVPADEPVAAMRRKAKRSGNWATGWR